MSKAVDSFMAKIKARDPNEPEFHQAVQEVAESVMSLADQRHSIETGFADLDRIIGGFYNYEFIVVAGRPGMGKSVFAGDIALYAGGQGKKVLIFSLKCRRNHWRRDPYAP